MSNVMPPSVDISFISTRASTRAYRFDQALFANLAADGGLFLPATHPRLPVAQIRTADDFATLASVVARSYDSRLEYTPSIYRRQIFPFAPRIRILHDRLALLELYHGPTCAFKDYGASFLAYNMSRIVARTRKRIIILTATSGDTGSAVAQAFYKKRNIDVVVLYPADRISTLQEAHINGFAHNIHAVRVRGSFDHCQALVKQAFADDGYGDAIMFSSANSINIGRLLPQSFYYHYAVHALRPRVTGAIHFCVPSGNIGNVTAGVLAWRAGLPVASFIVATNRNKTIPLYLRRGVYRARRTIRTISNAMDVGNPNNFERLHALYHRDYRQMRQHLRSYWASERETRAAIRRYDRRYGVVVDPHTATALSAAEKALVAEGAPTPAIGANDMIVCLATAHPCKFAHTVERVINRTVPLAPQLTHLADQHHAPEQTIAARYSALRDYLRTRFDLSSV